MAMGNGLKILTKLDCPALLRMCLNRQNETADFCIPFLNFVELSRVVPSQI